MIVWRMHIACWITMAIDTHSECVINVAFPQQEWVHERALMLRVYVHWLSCQDVTPYNPVDVQRLLRRTCRLQR
jgi:hypothetical protein